MDIPFLALSLLPIAFLAAALSHFKVKAHWATLGAALLALALALAFFRDHLPPAQIAPVVADGVGFALYPLKAVLMCLVANTTPTAYGSVGVPIATLAKVGGCDANALAGTTALLQLAVTALGPFLILLVYGGRAALRGIVPLALVADAAFLVPWFLAARFLGPELPDILGGLSVLACVALVATKGRLGGNLRAQLFAWAPFWFVVALLAGAAFLPTSLKRYTSPGTLVLVAGFLGGTVQGLSFKRMLRVLGKTLASYWTAFATICFVLVLARVMTAAGMVATLADALVAVTGSVYPFFAPLVGALGGFVTGSGTSANVLFGSLQTGAANALGVPANLLAGATRYLCRVKGFYPQRAQRLMPRSRPASGL